MFFQLLGILNSYFIFRIYDNSFAFKDFKLTFIPLSCWWLNYPKINAAGAKSTVLWNSRVDSIFPKVRTMLLWKVPLSFTRWISSAHLTLNSTIEIWQLRNHLGLHNCKSGSSICPPESSLKQEFSWKYASEWLHI